MDCDMVIWFNGLIRYAAGLRADEIGKLNVYRARRTCWECLTHQIAYTFRRWTL